MKTSLLHPLHARCLLGELLALLLIAAPAALVAQSDDFNDGNDAGWTHYDPLGGLGAGPMAVFSYPGGNSYRIQAQARPGALQSAGQSRVGTFQSGSTYSSFYVTVDLVNWNNSLDQAVGILARITTPGLGVTRGYVFSLQVADTDISISRIDGETPTDLAGSSKVFVPNPSKDYRMVFIGKGANFTGKIYELPNLVTPVITTSGIDSTYTSGTCGLLIADLTSTSSVVGGPADATFDNYFAAAAESPKLTISHYLGTTYRISWPGEATGFVLERSFELPTATWMEVPSNEIYGPFQVPFPSDDAFSYLADGFDTTYFRLRYAP